MEKRLQTEAGRDCLRFYLYMVFTVFAHQESVAAKLEPFYAELVCSSALWVLQFQKILLLKLTYSSL